METVVGLYSEVFETVVVLGVFHWLFNNKIYQRIKILWIYDWRTCQYSTSFELKDIIMLKTAIPALEK